MKLRRRYGLNPFFIRSAVGIHHERGSGQRTRSLNPFFIRSAVGIDKPNDVIPSEYVLIPSSSGLRLESEALAKAKRDARS